MYNHFKISETEGTILEFEDLLHVELKGDNLMAFKNAWELVLAGLKTTPSEEIMESLVRRQLERSVQLRELMSLYNQDIVQRGDKRSYERLMKMWTAHL